VLDDRFGTVIALDFPFTVSPSGGGLAVFCEEEIGDAFVLLGGYTPSVNDPDRAEALALVTVKGVAQAVYGYPNEGAFRKDPRGGLGHGFYEIVGSRWVVNINGYNRRSYGANYHGSAASTRHFFIGSKDASAQFLARDIAVEVFVGRSFKDVRSEALARLDRWMLDFVARHTQQPSRPDGLGGGDRATHPEAN
jgi:hypothetical protein